jgi:hypothetical protein
VQLAVEKETCSGVPYRGVLDVEDVVSSIPRDEGNIVKFCSIAGVGYVLRCRAVKG